MYPNMSNIPKALILGSFVVVVVMGCSEKGAITANRSSQQKASSGVVSVQIPYRNAGHVADDFWESDASAERKAILQQNWEKITEDELSRMPSKERVVKTYAAMTPKIFYNPKYDSSWIYKVVETNQEAAIHLFNVIFKDYDIAKRPGLIETPVFLAIGRYDYLCPYFLWDERKGILPNLSYNLFQKSGHFPMVEEQELFDKKLIEWFKSH
jgi:proline iminopeptidase